MATCPTCGRKAPAPRKGKRPARIACTGRTFPAQRSWYEESMRVKRGELVWSMSENAERFGARGGFITAEESARRQALRDAYPTDNPASRLDEIQRELDAADTPWDRAYWANRKNMLRNGVPVAA